jgi:mevalonate kinase
LKREFYSNGKLLITGEYVVLDGAKAFALPTKYGQNLIVEETNGNLIHWQSFDHDGSIWFEANIPFDSIIKKEKADLSQNVKNTLIEILHEAYKKNSDFITKSKGYKITTQLTFPKNWGLGTSSTLINNIAQWINIDAYTLLRNSFGGSGYDVACASNNSPIIYQLREEKPIVTAINFHPDFRKNLYFVYLNQKRNSKNAIAEYFRNRGDIFKAISKIDKITDKIITTDSLKEFTKEIELHEIELSNLLSMSTIKESLFEDFDGVIKSLGAWGGDFVMAISKNDPKKYFEEKGYPIVLEYEKMIL